MKYIYMPPRKFGQAHSESAVILSIIIGMPQALLYTVDVYAFARLPEIFTGTRYVVSYEYGVTIVLYN